MKLTRTARRMNGMTFLEIGVVVAVILCLIGILFVGGRARMKGSDRAANIMNIRNVQQAVRAHQGMEGMMVGDPMPASAIFGDARHEGYLKQPVPPTAGLIYTYGTNVPKIGELYLKVGGPAATEYGPAATTYADW